MLIWKYSISLRDGIENCPIDGKNGTAYARDKFAEKEIKQLIVCCYNKSHGCTWIGKLGLLEVCTL